MVPDNLGRVVENNEEGPPQFVKFGKSGTVLSSSSGSVSTKQSGPSIQKPRQSSPARETSTREKMELPSSYFAEGASKRREDAPSTVKHQDCLVSGMQNLSTNDSGVVDIEALVTSSERNPNLESQGVSSARTTSLNISNKSRNASGPLAQISHGESDRERGGRGRGRGRGRHRGEEDDDYRQEKRKGFMLSDFFSQREQQGRQHNEVQQRVDTVPNQWPELHTEYVRDTKDGGEIHGGGHDGSVVSGERSGREGRGRGRGRGMPRNRETENVSKKNWNSNEFSSEPTSRDRQNSLHDRDETSHARKGGDSRRQNIQQFDSLPNQNYTTKSKRRIDPQSEVTGTSGENKKMPSELVHDNADYKGNSSFHHTRKEHRRYEPYGNREQQERRGHRGYGTEGRGSNNDEDSNKSGRRENSEGRQHFRGKVQHSDKHREHRGTNSDRNYGEAKSYEPRSLSSQHGTSDSSSRRAVSVSSSKSDFTGSVSRSKASGSSGNNTSSLSQHASGTTVRRALSSSNYDTLGSSQHSFPASTQHSFPASTQHSFPASTQHFFPASTQHKVSGYDQAASQRGLHDTPKKNDYKTSVSSSSSSTATKVDTDDTSHWDFLYQTGSSKPASATKGKVDIL